jgi:two-component system cell cycle sensor histidine kinase/response regulator CckA
MMRQLLLFARGSDGEVGPLNLSEAVGEVADLVRETFGRSYTILFNPAPGLPDVLADPTQVHQIAMNLCVNARDAMPDGGSLTIGLDRRTIDDLAAAQAGPGVAPGDYLAVSVRDTGTGIPPEILPRLFDPFFTTKEEGQGTGLGLAICKRIVDQHHGALEVESEVGEGTTFCVTLPVRPPSEQRAPRPA